MIKTKTTETYIVATSFTNERNWLRGADRLVGITDQAFPQLPPELRTWCSRHSGSHSPESVVGITFQCFSVLSVWRMDVGCWVVLELGAMGEECS